jgi:glycosyltransferase involved in cell wall biosynthesis
MNLVSVIIPCYNQGAFVGEAIQSVLAQSHQHYEIIVVDDGSTDNSATVIRRYPSVLYIRQANLGLAAARNRGLEAATGEYLVFLDADDRVWPGHFCHGLRLFQERPDLGLVFGVYRLIGSAAGHHHRCEPRLDYYATLLRCNVITCPAVVLARRDVVRKLGGFSTVVPGAEDYDLFLNIAAQYPIACHHQVVADYRQHDDQMSKRLEVMLTGSMRALRGQRARVKSNPVHRQAYRQGLKAVRQRYGDPLLWKMTTAMRKRQWREVMRGLHVLAKYYPMGLGLHVMRKLRRVAVSAFFRKLEPS